MRHDRSGLTQSSDEVPIFASNQIVKDLYDPSRTSCDTRRAAGLETCYRRSVLTTKADVQPAPKKLKFLKELPGRLVSARGEGSLQVLLPFLNGVSSHYSTVETLRTNIGPARYSSGDPDFGGVSQNNRRLFSAQGQNSDSHGNRRPLPHSAQLLRAVAALKIIADPA